MRLHIALEQQKEESFQRRLSSLLPLRFSSQLGALDQHHLIGFCGPSWVISMRLRLNLGWPALFSPSHMLWGKSVARCPNFSSLNEVSSSSWRLQKEVTILGFFWEGNKITQVRRHPHGHPCTHSGKGHNWMQRTQRTEHFWRDP